MKDKHEKPHHYEAKTGLPVDCLPASATPWRVVHALDRHVVTAASEKAMLEGMMAHVEWLASPHHV